MNMPYPLLCWIHLIENNEYIFIWCAYTFTAASRVNEFPLNLIRNQVCSISNWFLHINVFHCVSVPSSAFELSIGRMILSKWHRLNSLCAIYCANYECVISVNVGANL